MKQFLLKTWLTMLCLLVFGSGTMWAEDVTQTYTLSTSNNGNSVTTGDVTWNIASGAIAVSSSNTKLTGTITVTLPTGATLQSVEITKSNAWGSGATVTFKAGSTTLNTFSTSGTFSLTSNKTNNTYTFTKTGDSSKNAWVKDIKVTYTPGDSGNGGASSNDGTYNFADMTNFSSWDTGYAKKTTTFSDGAYAELESANKSTTTITDCPVTKGNYVIFKAPTGKKISSLTFTCTQWTTKAQTITLNTSSDGTNYTATATTSSNFVLSASDLTNVSAVKFTFSSASNQVGIKSIEVTYASAEPVQIPNLLTKTSDDVKVTDYIDLSKYVNKPNDYTGDITYTVTSGADKCVIADEALEITKAGEITVKVSAAAAGNYLLTEGTITFTATKNELGEFLKQANLSLVKDDIQAMSELLTLGNYDGTISYESDKASVADVDDGVLLAYAIGSANITITAPDTEAWVGGTKTLAVTVSGKAPTILTENKTYTLIKDGTAAATTTTADDGLTVKFRSANAEVATVDDAGVITAVAAGSTTIYAYTEANDDYAAGEEVYANVSVVEPVITFTPEAGSFAADNTPVKVNVTGIEDYIYVTDPNIADDFDTNTDGIEIGDAETEILISATTTIRVKAYDSEDNVSPMVSATFTRKQQPNIQIAGIENGSTKNITWGDEFEMPTVTAADGAVLNYRSSAYSVAAFDGSTLNILKAGTTTITVSVAENEDFIGEEYSFTLTIAKATPTVNFTTAGNQEIYIDDTDAKAYEYTCNTAGLAVSYSSSNTNVVTVDAETGALNPLKTGTAIIYAKTPSGQDNYYQGSAQYDITIKKHDATLAWNDGEGANVNYEIGETDFAGWTATTNSDNPVTYKSSATSVATVDANTGAVTVVGKGTATITASVAASDTYNAATIISYTITASNGIMYFHEIASVNDIVEGAKYLIVQPTNQKATTTISSNRLQSTSVSIENSSLSLDDVNATGKPYVVQFEKNGENWLIKASYGYIIYGGSSTNIDKNATLPATVPNTYKWKITMDVDGVRIQNVSADTRYLMFNSSNELRPFVPGTSYSYPTLYAQTATTINISQYQNTTLSLKTPYVMPEGLVGKTVSASEGSDGNYTLTLTKKYNEGDVVPAGEALVVQGAQGTYTALAATTSAAKTAYPDNLLVAEYTPQDTKFLTSFDSENSGNYYYYKLTTKDGANFGWYYGAEDGVPFLMTSKERAYLVIAKDVANSIRAFRLEDLEAEGTLTGVEAIEAQTNETIFNLQGQRMNRLQKGVNIINGKKVLR